MKIDPRSLSKMMSFEDEGMTRQKVVHPQRESRDQQRKKRDYKAQARRKQEQRYA